MKKVTKDFPLLENNPDLTYLDSAATSLKPKLVLKAVREYFTEYGANIHRGLYKISERASEEYESTRKVVADFINAPSEKEIIFTRNATESINLVAHSLGKEILDPGDFIVTTIAEHHANFVPWQTVAQETGAELKVIDVTDDGDLDIYDKNGKVDLTDIITEETWILAIQYVSNVLGTVQPLKEIIAEAKRLNPKIIIVVDGAQAVPHMKVDVQDLGCDFLAFSGHKAAGPTGIGVLWGRTELLESMPPYMTGGDMIEEVHLNYTTFADIPHKFEAGTPHIAGVIGLKAAIKYLDNIGMDTLFEHEKNLGAYAIQKLEKEFGDDIWIMGQHSRNTRIGLVSFTLNNCHPHDIAAILDEENVAVRAGHHCAMPLHTRFDGNATTRASFYMYNSENDIDTLVVALRKAYDMLCPSIKK